MTNAFGRDYVINFFVTASQNNYKKNLFPTGATLVSKQHFVHTCIQKNSWLWSQNILLLFSNATIFLFGNSKVSVQKTVTSTPLNVKNMPNNRKMLTWIEHRKGTKGSGSLVLIPEVMMLKNNKQGLFSVPLKEFMML